MMALALLLAGLVPALRLGGGGPSDEVDDGNLSSGATSDPSSRPRPKSRAASSTRKNGSNQGACLCIFDVDRTLSAKPTTAGGKTFCPGSQPVRGVNAKEYERGDFTLSDLGINLESTKCGMHCYLGVISASGYEAGKMSTVADIFTRAGLKHPIRRKDACWRRGHGRIYGYVLGRGASHRKCPYIMRTPEGRKQEFVKDIISFHMKMNPGVKFGNSKVHFYDDVKHNVEGFISSKSPFRAHQISCEMRAGRKGECGATVAEADRGYHSGRSYLCGKHAAAKPTDVVEAALEVVESKAGRQITVYQTVTTPLSGIAGELDTFITPPKSVVATSSQAVDFLIGSNRNDSRAKSLRISDQLENGDSSENDQTKQALSPVAAIRVHLNRFAEQFSGRATCGFRGWGSKVSEEACTRHENWRSSRCVWDGTTCLSCTGDPPDCFS